ncbi:MAG: M28 family peptidase, partial [Firmicutes bacterium]|nr:M28 family peptidase [Bacillota bacterium]
MDQKQLKQIFLDTDFVHRSGTPEELKVAEYLKAQCEALGVSSRIEAFPVAMGDVEEAHVFADGEEIPCKGFACCGSGEVEAELYYMPSLDPVSMAGAKDRIVLLDQQGIGYFDYQDLVKAGAKGILFRYNDMHFPNHDIDERDLRPHVVGDAPKLLSAMLHVSDAVKLVERSVKRAKIVIRQTEYGGESHNVIAEIPGRRPEWITLSAHYDTTALSHGSYDNMSGCAGLLGVMDALKDADLNYGLRFVFCGSEERGLLGSKAYVRDHEAELENIALNINLDMIGCTMGKFIACVSAEEALASYLRYLGAELNFPVASRTGVYS